MTTTVAKVILSRRERQVVVGLADGSTLPEVALKLQIRGGTAAGYLRLAKRKLFGLSENPAMLAAAYATDTIAAPELLDPERVFLPREQRALIPLIAQGMRATQMAIGLDCPVELVRRDGRDLMRNLGARNPAHVVTRAWQYQLLTAEQVIAWLP